MDYQTRYDTNDVATPDRFAFWRESVCDSYVKLGCEAENPRDFTGVIEIARHSVLSVSKVSGLAHKAERRKCDINSSATPIFSSAYKPPSQQQSPSSGKLPYCAQAIWRFMRVQTLMS